MAATRRLAAILASDVAGYSRLMGADEEGTLEPSSRLPTAVPLPPEALAAHRRLPRTSPERRAGNLSDADLQARISRAPDSVCQP